MTTAQNLIDKLELEPHPEGGFFKETYRSEGVIPNEVLGAQFSGDRNYTTAIYFLLTSDNFSAFHRVLQDEFWHFHQGSAIELHMISPEGEHSIVIIGNDIAENQVPQFVVPGGYWFAAHVIDNDSHSLVSCTVSPGFDFADFELASRAQLTQQFPELEELIAQYTR